VDGYTIKNRPTIILLNNIISTTITYFIFWWNLFSMNKINVHEPLTWKSSYSLSMNKKCVERSPKRNKCQVTCEKKNMLAECVKEYEREKSQRRLYCCRQHKIFAQKMQTQTDKRKLDCFRTNHLFATTCIFVLFYSLMRVEWLHNTTTQSSCHRMCTHSQCVSRVCNSIM